MKDEVLMNAFYAYHAYHSDPDEDPGVLELVAKLGRHGETLAVLNYAYGLGIATDSITVKSHKP